MRVYGLGPQRAKRLRLTGDRIKGKEAERLALILEAVPSTTLDTEVEVVAAGLAWASTNQLAIQRLAINQTVKSLGLGSTQTLATLRDQTPFALRMSF